MPSNLRRNFSEGFEGLKGNEVEVKRVIDKLLQEAEMDSEKGIDRKQSQSYDPPTEEFAVNYSLEEQKAIRRELDKKNILSLSRISLEKTKEENYAKTEKCNEFISKEFGHRVQRILKALKFPNGWVKPEEEKKRFARTLYDKSTPIWTRYSTIQYFADESFLTFFTIRRILNELKKREPEYRPKSLLDFGAGTGSSILAAEEVYGDSINSANAIEINRDMAELGKINTRDCKIKSFWQKELEKEHIKEQDITIAAFSLSETKDHKKRNEILDKLWKKTKNFLVLIEAGEPYGADVIQKSRDYILTNYPPSVSPKSTGSSAIAPCSHDKLCPIAQFKRKKRIWCHFAQKIPITNLPHNSSLQTNGPLESVRNVYKTPGNSTRIKPGSLVEEGKKEGMIKVCEVRRVFEHVFRFSYVILKKGQSRRRRLEDRRVVAMLRGTSEAQGAAERLRVQPLDSSTIWPRVIEPPKKNKGHVVMKICTDGNIESRVITKSFGKQEYGQAKGSQWGDLWPYQYRKVVTKKREHRLKFLEQSKAKKKLIEEDKGKEEALAQYKLLLLDKKNE